MEILVTIRSVYGNTMVYPTCGKAQLLARLTGKKTFSPADIDTIKALGYRVRVSNPEFCL